MPTQNEKLLRLRIMATGWAISAAGSLICAWFIHGNNFTARFWVTCAALFALLAAGPTYWSWRMPFQEPAGTSEQEPGVPVAPLPPQDLRARIVRALVKGAVFSCGAVLLGELTALYIVFEKTGQIVFAVDTEAFQIFGMGAALSFPLGVLYSVCVDLAAAKKARTLS